MKKVMYFMGCALFVAAMAVACGGEQKKAEDQNAQKNPQEQTDPKGENKDNGNTAQAGASETDQTIGENAQGTGEKVANELINAAGDKAIQEGKDLINNL